MNRGAPIRFDEVYKSFGGFTALHPTTLHIEAGEFLTLLGPSGSGKTTLLNIAAGYLLPDGGSVTLGTRDITGIPPQDRNIGMMFQSYALFPHMSVFDNVAYGLKVRRRSREEIRARVIAALEMVKLSGFEKRAIQQLSGGQQQRVALARAMIIEPDLLLMDEPLGALDRQLRRHVQLEIRRLHEQTRRTTIYVTHDQEEALVMSDRIAVLNGGRLEQVASPSELYARPKNVFVASFLGESNLLPVSIISQSGGHAVIRLQGGARELHVETRGEPFNDCKAHLLVRPEHLRPASDAEWGINAQVVEQVYLGELMAVRLRLETGAVVWMRSMTSPLVKVGENMRIAWDGDNARLLNDS